MECKYYCLHIFVGCLLEFVNEEEKLIGIIGRIENICSKYGLKLNRQKCKILIINDDTGISEIEGIEVVQSIKYLGVLIGNKKSVLILKKLRFLIMLIKKL